MNELILRAHALKVAVQEWNTQQLAPQQWANSLLTFLSENICHPVSIQGINEMLYMPKALQLQSFWEMLFFVNLEG